ncbi:hypothetical protein U9M48_002558 [Paspalum notatum var. saurae]|uniref:Uncharacterized protein n=1 Tax=Paspalum notatum var. saurae TaxID=547442 RepID=A0AAQ3PRK4_PASNO
MSSRGTAGSTRRSSDTARSRTCTSSASPSCPGDSCFKNKFNREKSTTMVFAKVQQFQYELEIEKQEKGGLRTSGRSGNHKRLRHKHLKRALTV